MIEDRELDALRAQWSGTVPPVLDSRRILQKIRRQQVRFVVDNVLGAASFVGGLIFAFYVRKHQAEVGTGWAAGVSILMFVTLGLRAWIQRGTWRAEAQTTRGFLELSRKRLIARIRLSRASAYVAVAWLVCSAMFTALNWQTLKPDMQAHPAGWLGILIGSIVLMPIVFAFTAWIVRRKQAELEEVQRFLDEV